MADGAAPAGRGLDREEQAQTRVMIIDMCPQLACGLLRVPRLWLYTACIRRLWSSSMTELAADRMGIVSASVVVRGRL